MEKSVIPKCKKCKTNKYVNVRFDWLFKEYVYRCEKCWNIWTEGLLKNE